MFARVGFTRAFSGTSSGCLIPLARLVVREQAAEGPMITAALIAPERRGYGSPAASLFDGFPAASVPIGKKRLKEPTHPRKSRFLASGSEGTPTGRKPAEDWQPEPTPELGVTIRCGAEGEGEMTSNKLQVLAEIAAALVRSRSQASTAAEPSNPIARGCEHRQWSGIRVYAGYACRR
jgi:hypothetical protein